MTSTDYKSLWLMLADVDFEQKHVEIDGIRTRLVVAGPADGETVVMLHGTGGHWETFIPTIRDLSRTFRCVAFDMVGNGLTDKPDHDYEIPVYIEHVLGVLDVLGIHRAHFIGMSLGAWVVARLAEQHPDRVDRIVLLSPAGLIATQSNMERIRAERSRAVEEADWDAIHAMFEHLIADEENRLPDLIALRQSIYRRDDTRERLDRWLALQDPVIRDRNLITEEEWRRIAAPTLIVASGKDHGEYQSTARQVAGLIPDARVLEMPEVRHWPHFEDPELFNPAVASFLGDGSR